MSGTNRRRGLSPVENMLIAGTSGIAGKVADAPFERVKLLLQSQREIINAGRMTDPYKGIRDCIARTYRTEGFLSFWRGNLIACIGVLPQQALTFGLQQKFKQFQSVSRSDSIYTKIAKSIATGGAAACASLVIMHPLGYCRTRLANDVIFTDSKGEKQRQFKGIIDVYRKTWASDGIVGMYRGFFVSCFGIFVYRSFYFGFYDTLRGGLVNSQSMSLQMITSFAVGVASTLLAGLVAYPFDTIRVRMQMRSIEPTKYKSSLQCGFQILKNEGFRPLMNGAMVVILKGLCGGAMLVFFDVFRSQYTQWRKDDK
ncbi:hypothetical protein FSP39_022165 [Pinctada imbricata]|uniref:ADP/ATP translocase n=1 Tax=Pinctada imbricata TaxID=66713 RepID=A0AA88XXR3_PINIB|nr:hypothetical protein FSP39_022165 [Pinctada imbricata]